MLGTSAAQQQLVPALMRVYGQADFVVGLDVDKDDYDKFSVSSSEIRDVEVNLWLYCCHVRVSETAIAHVVWDYDCIEFVVTIACLEWQWWLAVMVGGPYCGLAWMPAKL